MGDKPFSSLNMATRTVLLSVFHQYGKQKNIGLTELFKSINDKNWPNAVDQLINGKFLTTGISSGAAFKIRRLLEGNALYRANVDLCTGVSPNFKAVFVVDSSHSIGEYQYENARKFLKELVGNWEIGEFQIEVGLIVYGTYVEVVSDFSKDKNVTLNAIKNMEYLASKTATGDGINMAIKLFEDANFDSVCPKIMFVITDGFCNVGVPVDEPMERVKAMGIQTIAVATAIFGVNNTEIDLIAVDKKNRYDLKSYIELANYLKEFKYLICSIPGNLEGIGRAHV